MMLASHLVGTPEEHVDWLEALWQLPEGARVMDAGCGVGEVSRLLARIRPDIDFLLVNKDAGQLAECPAGFPRLCGDFSKTGLPDASFDGIMFSWSFGYGGSLQECARLLKPGGKLLLWEPSGNARTRGLLMEFHNYTTYPAAKLLAMAAQAGFRLRAIAFPETDTSLVEAFAQAHEESGVFEKYFSLIIPQLIILEKR